MATGPILIISGTNRPNANTLRVARLIDAHYRAAGAVSEVFSLQELPPEMFDPVAYAQKPPAIVALQQRVFDARGLHVVTPEYNGSFPGVLKYFIDMLKFPESFEHKPVAFTGIAAGLWGGLRPVEQLQQVFAYRNGYLYPDRVFIPGIGKVMHADGNMTDPAINDRLSRQAAGFAKFADTFLIA